MGKLSPDCAYLFGHLSVGYMMVYDICGLNYLHSRHDRYNKKLKKYQVVYGEEEDSVSEDEEKRESKDHEAFCCTWLNFLSSVPTSPFSLSCLLSKSHPLDSAP